MAEFAVKGIDGVVADMKRLGELVGETADRMLLAGAQEEELSWRSEATRRDFRRTGDMIESIGYPKKPKTASGVRKLDIYPQGTGSSGVRNAAKAFVLHYGREGTKSTRRRYEKKKFAGPGIPQTDWVDAAEADAEPRVAAAYEHIWDDHLKGK